MASIIEAQLNLNIIKTSLKILNVDFDRDLFSNINIFMLRDAHVTWTTFSLKLDFPESSTNVWISIFVFAYPPSIACLSILLYITEHHCIYPYQSRVQDNLSSLTWKFLINHVKITKIIIGIRDIIYASKKFQCNRLQ